RDGLRILRGGFRNCGVANAYGFLGLEVGRRRLGACAFAVRHRSPDFPAVEPLGVVIFADADAARRYLRHLGTIAGFKDSPTSDGAETAPLAPLTKGHDAVGWAMRGIASRQADGRHD